MPVPTPTGLLMNWVNVSVTPFGGSAIPVLEVTAVSQGRSSRQEAFYGDNRRFAALIKSVELKRMISISSGNGAALASIPDDTPCTVTATLADPRNGIANGGGGIAVTLVNAVLEKESKDGQNNKYAANTAHFNAYGVMIAGVESDPLTVAAL